MASAPFCAVDKSAVQPTVFLDITLGGSGKFVVFSFSIVFIVK